MWLLVYAFEHFWSGTFVTLLSDLGWSSLETSFVVDFFFLFFPWIIFQPEWFPNLVESAASQMCASRFWRGWKDEAMELSSWRQGGTDGWFAQVWG